MRIYLNARNAAAALDFYRRAFGAQEIMRWIDPGPGANEGKVGHSEIRIGEQILCVADAYADMEAIGLHSPDDLGGTTVHFWLYMDDVEGALQRALDAGAKLLLPLDISAASGNRRCRIADPAGHIWTLADIAFA